MLIGRVEGPMTFRFILQPLVAVYFGIRSGLKDAKAGRCGYIRAVLLDLKHYKGLLREGWKDVGKIFVAAIIIDVLYELFVFHWAYPIQPLIVAAVVAVPPYVIARGLTNWIARHYHHQS